MKKTGILVAVEIEPVLKKYGEIIKEENVMGFKVYSFCHEGHEITVIHSGAGQIAAAAATTLLADRYKVDLVVNFGIVGGLTEEMESQRLCIVDKIVHYDFDTSSIDNVEVGRYLHLPDVFIRPDESLIKTAERLEPSLKRVTCASGDKFIDGEDRKILHDKFGADICEMEAAAVALTCLRADIPCVLLKTVADSIKGGADEFKTAFEETSAICFDLADRLIREV